jgi:eukaryotic-like serine/threonine-protein kinase
MIGTSLNQYHITAGIGAGGMGEVFRAQDTRLNRDVAVKVLPKDFVVSDADRLRRFAHHPTPERVRFYKCPG